jgi:hypothetical protein
MWIKYRGTLPPRQVLLPSPACLRQIIIGVVVVPQVARSGGGVLDRFPGSQLRQYLQVIETFLTRLAKIVERSI